ncbi:MAG TPA: class 1 fructose-bisphosphatase [Anaerolineales bacterium]|nr:class 1 fructose-bisphosphatase [Anaerolineales bacterium]
MFYEPLDHNKIITIERHIFREQQAHPEATGVLTSLLYDLALAGKVIASQTTRGGLAEILGRSGSTNVQGEEVMKLDELADRTIYRLNNHTGRLAVMASEEQEGLMPIPEQYPTGKYVLLYDPLDGSSNIDYNVSIGTIFAIYRRKTEIGAAQMEDCLRLGRELVVAGYLIYGASTMLVYTSGMGVHGFTLDPSVGEFLLTHPNIRNPEKPLYYSVNQGYEKYWSEGIRRFTRYLQGDEPDGNGKYRNGMSLRYIGSMVADLHRTLLSGGVFYYPADNKNPKYTQGKLRLVYEGAPMAYIFEQAGGCSSDGRQNLLDLQPESLHQRTPLFIGNHELIEQAEDFIRRYDLEESN